MKVDPKVAAFSQGPVAIIVSSSAGFSFATGGFDAEAGFIIVLKGKDKGVYPIIDFGGVLASTCLADGGGCIKATGVFFTGNPEDFSINRHFIGTRTELNISVGAPVPGVTPTFNFGGFRGKSVDLNITYGLYIGTGVGGNLFPLNNMVSGSINIGGTDAAF